MTEAVDRNTQIVLEGADGAGKSSLASQLSSSLSRKVIHTGGPIRSSEELLQKVEDIERRPDQVIFDRVPLISNYIYAAAENRPTFFDFNWYMDRLQEWDPLLVFCGDTDMELQRERISEKTKLHKPREYLETVKQNFPRVHQSYQVIFHMLKVDVLFLPPLRIFSYNFRTDSYPHLLSELRKELQTHSRKGR